MWQSQKSWGESDVISVFQMKKTEKVKKQKVICKALVGAKMAFAFAEPLPLESFPWSVWEICRASTGLGSNLFETQQGT